jgi:menaquinone-dependent protoporphyrinogen oxidase
LPYQAAIAARAAKGGRMSRVLILYGTTDGHTRLIAESIGDALRLGGVEADVVRAGTADPHPSWYDGVIVAASLHAGGYQKAVEHWVRAHARDFGSRPTAFVSACLSVLNKSPKAIADLDQIVTRFSKTTGWKPMLIEHVAGALLYTRYNFIKRWLMKRIVSQQGGETDTSKDYEYTDWVKVRRFAEDFRRRVAAAA